LSFLSGAITEYSDPELDAEQEDDENFPKTPVTMTPSSKGAGMAFHSLKQCVAPGKTNATSWTSFYLLDVELRVLIKTLKDCLNEENFSSIDEATRENIFSTLLCFISPWRISDLPGAKESHGPFTKTFTVKPLLEALDVIYLFAKEHPKSKWMVALVSIVTDATRLQFQAVSESDQQDANTTEETSDILTFWRKVSEILMHVAKTSTGVNSRQTAIESLLVLSRDISYCVLDKTKNPNSKLLLEDGCIIFVRYLLQLESHLDDTPRSFNGKKSNEKEICQSWLMNLTNPPIEESWEVSPVDESKSFSKNSHLFIFLPIAFKLLQCDSEEVKDIALIITSTVDIAALVSSYTEISSELKELKKSSKE